MVYTRRLKRDGIQISSDGRGRALDILFVERLWRAVNWEEVWLSGYQAVAEALSGSAEYVRLYSHQRPLQALDDRTPA